MPPNSYWRWSMPNCGGWRRGNSPRKSRAKRSAPRGWSMKPTCDCSAAAKSDREQQHWDSRGHFFAAAAEAMRRILIDNARRKKRLKHGGGRQQVELLDRDLAIHDSPDELLALDEALVKLALEDPSAAQVVKLRVFTGLSIEQVAEVLGCSRATAYRHWSYARAWLRCELQGKSDPAGI